MFSFWLIRRATAIGAAAAAAIASPLLMLTNAAAATAQTPPAAAAAAAAGAKPVQRSGRYVVEMRLPVEGVAAGREVEIGFRVTDASQEEDPALGAPGVTRAKITGSISAVPPLPSSRPGTLSKIHGKGVPGDYGLTAAFPQGGDYAITLNILPPGETRGGFTVSFPVAVRGEDASGGGSKPVSPPYTLVLSMEPRFPTAGQAVTMTMTVNAAATGAAVRDFDVAHEQKMHLLIVRDDLGAFFHEYPTLRPDGTFTQIFTFPTGGDWRVFGDVAPRGAGSQVMMAKVGVNGARGLRATLMPQAVPVVRESGLMLLMKPTRLTARKTIPMTFTLTNNFGQPVADLQPFRGASAARLILIEKDAETFVPAHLDDADPRNGRSGTLTFLARFPKPGLYKGWMQFQRAGRVVTLPFVVRATEK